MGTNRLIPPPRGLSTRSYKLFHSGSSASASLSNEHLQIAHSYSRNDELAVIAPVTNQLHRQLQPKIDKLLGMAERLGNQPGWSDLAGTSKEFAALARKPLPEIAASIGDFWSLSTSLGRFHAQNEEASRAKSTYVPALEPDAQRMLLDVVTTAAVLVRQFPTAVALDDHWRSFQSGPEPVEAAKRLLSSARDEDVILQDQIRIVQITLAVPVSEKARGRSVATVRNLVYQDMRVVALAGGLFVTGYIGELGIEVAQQDKLVPKVREWLIQREADVAEPMKAEPADSKAAAKEILRRAKIRR